MCGEHPGAAFALNVNTGSSPHVRGAHLFGIVGDHGTGIIPACAGSTDIFANHQIGAWDHPRMCGEHLLLLAGFLVVEGSSPHVRGALQTCP